jgi:mono/diheme cytochrome c family protein
VSLKAISQFRKRTLLLLLGALFLCIGVGHAQKREDSDEKTATRFSPEAAATFNKRCSSCHTYGRGVKIGPDLKGVNERHTREWLIKFIGASSKLLKSGDPTATSLFVQFNRQRMPDWTDLSDQQIGDILDYIAIGGPDIKPADERNAELATAADVNEGRRLFLGEVRFRYGAHTCAACHSVTGTGLRGGTLGPDLSNVYATFQDRALTDFFRRPCFQSVSPSIQYLTSHESFVLKAFLYQTAKEHSATNNSKPTQVVLTSNNEQISRQPSSSSQSTRRDRR